jgi:hypothetical protein
MRSDWSPIFGPIDSLADSLPSAHGSPNGRFLLSL